MTDHTDNRPQVEYTHYLHLTAALLCTVGRWWCDLPEQDLTVLRDLRRDMKSETGLNCMTNGNRKLLRRFNDRKLAKRALLMPQAVIDEHKGRRGFTSSELHRCRRAAMVAVQFGTALRPKNLASLRIGKHVIEEGGKIHIHIPASEMKNKVEMEFVLSDRWAKVLRFYIANVRSLMDDADTDFLWPNAKGKALTSGYVGGLLGNFMEVEIGVRVTGHRFRHVAGYLYLLDNPNGFEVVRLLLGHKSIKTTMTYYASLEVKEGHKRYDAFIERRLQERADGSDDEGGADA